MQISDGDIKWLNQLVILPSWTYIPVLCSKQGNSLTVKVITRFKRGNWKNTFIKNFSEIYQ